MKKGILLFFILHCWVYTSLAQQRGQHLIDSLLLELPKVKEDTNGVNLLNGLLYSYTYVNPDKGISYGKEGLAMAKKLKWVQGIAATSSNIGGNYERKYDYDNALGYE